MANLEHDLLYGLHTAKSPDANPHYLQIGDSTLINYRKDIAAPDPPGGILADYIPFYLGPRSPMLFQIATGWEDIQKHPQEDIIYYISSLGMVKSTGLQFFFTDGHARSKTSTAYTDEADLQKLDWDAIYATNWKSDELDLRRKEKKQSEFFVKGHVPFSCIEHIGVFNKTAGQKVLYLFNSHSLNTPIKISPERLYYDHL